MIYYDYIHWWVHEISAVFIGYLCTLSFDSSKRIKNGGSLTKQNCRSLCIPFIRGPLQPITIVDYHGLPSVDDLPVESLNLPTSLW